MSTDTARAEIRQLVKENSASEFTKMHTRDELNAQAAELGIEDAGDLRTKQDVYEAIVGSLDLPDPTLRGESTIESPVATVFNFCDANREAIASDEMRRKDVVEALQEQGVAYYTARTQYQRWFSLTNKGERAVDEVPNDDLPRDLRTVEEVVEDDE